MKRFTYRQIRRRLMRMFDETYKARRLLGESEGFGLDRCWDMSEEESEWLTKSNALAKRLDKIDAMLSQLDREKAQRCKRSNI